MFPFLVNVALVHEEYEVECLTTSFGPVDDLNCGGCEWYRSLLYQGEKLR